ncbi:MAG: response regulator [Anaerolineae bacterium]|nr:response regulator [Anaerolineae bacterium]
MYHLLIAEDEPIFRQFTAMALEMEGYHIRAVGSGKDALNALREELPDLLILDVSMPDMSGWDVITHVHDDPALSHTPILLLTANADEDTQRRALAEKLNGVLIKPVSIHELLNTVQHTLENRT